MPWTAVSRRDVLLGGAVAGLVSSTRPAASQASAPPEVRLLAARPGSVRLAGPDRQPTPIWGFSGSVPGPTIRARRGDATHVRLVNELSEPTSLHWHGIRLANGMDGVPHLTQAPVAPGASFDYSFTSPDAGTFWYHASQPGGRSRGLSGLLLVDEIEPIAADRDVGLLLDAWRLREDGSVVEPDPLASEDAGRSPNLQTHLTVNGLPVLDIPVRMNERMRLRLVNASDALVSVSIDGHRLFVMALDGQPAEPFIARDSRLFLGPGNRADVLLDAALEPGANAPVMIETADGTRAAVARLVYATGAAARAMPLPDPAPLPANPLPARMDFVGALRHDVPVEGPTANEAVWSRGARADAGALGPPLLSVRRGRVVMLAFANRMEAPVALHVHGHAFRLLDRLDDGWKPFWLDTLVVFPRLTLRIAFIADNPGKWLIDGRVLGSRITSMWTWFEVL